MGQQQPDRQTIREPDETGSPQGRPVVSLLLVIHLVLVATALSGNHFPSALQNRLVALFSPYLRVLNFDLNYTPYHLTQGTVDDQDHRVEILPQGGESPSEEGWVRLAPTGWRIGERYHRTQRLASALAFFAERQQNQQAALFARSIAEHSLNQLRIEPAQLRCRRILPQERTAVAAGTAGARDALDETYLTEIYRANTIVDGATVSVMKVEQAGQVASPDAGGRGP